MSGRAWSHGEQGCKVKETEEEEKGEECVRAGLSR